jgi:hypothetical protein
LHPGEAGVVSLNHLSDVAGIVKALENREVREVPAAA